jgi:hypothetical protein
MNAASERPEAYGVFKPVGHVIISFPPEADLQGAVSALSSEGFGNDVVTVYSAPQMKRQCEEDIARAGVLSTIGQELNLVKALRDLADQGYGFLMVRASKDDAVQRVAAVARRFRAERAQKFGHLLIEELISVGSNEKQVAESPDRGLDAQTRSGVEGDAHR